MEHGEKCFVKTHSYYENGGWVVWVSPYRRGCKISLLSTRHRRWALSKWFIPSWFQVVMLQKQRIGGEQKRKIFLEYLALMAFGNKYCSLVERCWTDWLKIWYHKERKKRLKAYAPLTLLAKDYGTICPAIFEQPLNIWFSKDYWKQSFLDDIFTGLDSVLHLDFVRLSYSHLWVLEEVLKPTMMMMMMMM